jgi:sugar phosphate isomerase/epimerase
LPYPANHGESAFQEMLASIGKLVAEAERFGVCVGFEAVHCHTVSTAQKMRRVLDAIRSKNLRVVFDPANLLTPVNFCERSRILSEALDLLGDDIAVIHAKDLVCENGALKTVPAGQGELDFAPILGFVHSHKSVVSVLLEEVGEQATPAAADFLRKQFEEILA